MTSRIGRTVPPRRNCSAGFTLVEVLLALTILLLIASAAVVATPSLRAGKGFDAGVMRFATALRMSRAEAALRGRRIRLSFSDTGAAQLQWEPDPLGQPGQFTAYGPNWADDLNADDVTIVSCQPAGVTPQQVMTAWNGEGGTGVGGDATARQALTFYPDGSCDSASVELSPTDPADLRRATVTLDGATGLVTTATTAAMDADGVVEMQP